MVEHKAIKGQGSQPGLGSSNAAADHVEAGVLQEGTTRCTNSGVLAGEVKSQCYSDIIQ